jgi:hypothetical protein
MRAHVIAEFIEHCTNVDFGIEYKSEDPPNFNPYGMLPTFKENQKLQAIGAKIDARHPKFFELVHLLRITNIHDMDYPDHLPSHVIDVAKFTKEVKEILMNGEDIQFIEIERLWKEKKQDHQSDDINKTYDKKDKDKAEESDDNNEVQDSEDDSYVVDYGSVYDEEVFP